MGTIVINTYEKCGPYGLCCDASSTIRDVNQKVPIFAKLSADLGVGPPRGYVRECGAIAIATFDYLFLTSGQYIDNR